MSSRIPWLRPRGLRSNQAEKRFRTLLVNGGVDLVQPTTADVARAWSVMQEFAKELVVDIAPPEADGDLLLAQYGTYDWGDGEYFSLDLTRQFIFNDRRGEHLRMSHLHCTFEFEPIDQLRQLGLGDLWSSDLDLDEFFEQVRSSPGFVAVQQQELRPSRLRIEYEQV